MRVTSSEYDATARSDCFVCRIVERQPLFPDPRIVFEDEAVVAFLNQFPTQEGYTLVCPKRHVERFESDLTVVEWTHLMEVVHRVAAAVTGATGAMRVYVASLGSPERNAHIHIHICPCPAGTPFVEQQFAAIQTRDGRYLQLSPARLDALAEQILRLIPAV